MENKHTRIHRVKILIFLTLTVLFLSFFKVYSQQQQLKSFCLEGVLSDTSGKMVDFATITILSVIDSSYIKGSISNENGNFKIEDIPQGEYILNISHLLYKRKYINIDIEKNTVLNPVLMEENTVELGLITVEANVIQHKADRYIVSLKNNPITKGNNTNEVLALMPGITNEENTLKINGREVSEIYVDGRKLRDRRELDAIQAEYIDKVEIVHMSGSEETAANMGGIIYVKLNKVSDGGYYGSVSGDFSVKLEDGYFSDNINASFNYRYKKLSVYNYIHYADFKNIEKYDTYYHYKNSGQFINMKTHGKGWSNFFSDRLSLTYEINEKHSIGGNFRLGINNGSPVNSSHSIVKNNIGKTIDVSGSMIKEELRNRQYQAALNYNWVLDDKGSMFKFIADYLRYDNNKIQDNYYQYNPGKDEVDEERTNNNVDDKTDMVEIDARLEKKMNDKRQLDVGLNYSLNKSNQLLDFQNLENSSWENNPDLSDNYKLKGENYAGFATVSSALGENFIYKVGVRVQENRIKYSSIKMKRDNTKRYWGIYPSLNLMYNINRRKGTSIGLSYQRAMNPIPYSAINPVVTYISEYSYTKGNLNIKPVNYDMVTVEGIINAQWNINYLIGFADDVLFFKTFQDEENPLVSYTMPINEGSNYMHALFVDRTFKLKKWWRLKATGRMQWIKYEGKYANSSSWRPYLAINNEMNFNNGWGGNLSGYLEPTYKTEDRTYKTVHGINGKIYKYLLNNKLLLNLDFTLYRYNRKLIIDTPEIWTKEHYKTNESGFRIKVIYNFSGGKEVTVKKSRSIQNYYEYKDD